MAAIAVIDGVRPMARTTSAMAASVAKTIVSSSAVAPISGFRKLCARFDMRHAGQRWRVLESQQSDLQGYADAVLKPAQSSAIGATPHLCKSAGHGKDTGPDVVRRRYSAAWVCRELHCACRGENCTGLVGFCRVRPLLNVRLL